MICPNCNADLPSRECPECLERVPLQGEFCLHCGARIGMSDDPDLAVGPETESSNDELDFSKRVLCSDGNCIGIINEKGLCNECGKPYTGEPE